MPWLLRLPRKQRRRWARWRQCPAQARGRRRRAPPMTTMSAFDPSVVRGMTHPPCTDADVPPWTQGAGGSTNARVRRTPALRYRCVTPLRERHPTVRWGRCPASVGLVVPCQEPEPVDRRHAPAGQILRSACRDRDAADRGTQGRARTPVKEVSGWVPDRRRSSGRRGLLSSGARPGGGCRPCVGGRRCSLFPRAGLRGQTGFLRRWTRHVARPHAGRTGCPLPDPGVRDHPLRCVRGSRQLAFGGVEGGRDPSGSCLGGGYA